MTSTINFTDLTQKIELLKTLHVESQKDEYSMAERDRYIEVRKEVSAILTPLFTDLNFADMLILWTSGQPILNCTCNGQPAHTHATNTIQQLEFVGDNSGIQFEVKE
jgi:hypothetical protein